MRYVLLASLCVLFVLAGCSGERRASGAGVDAVVLDRAGLSDVYFNYYGNSSPTIEGVEQGLSGDGEYLELFRFTTLVQNRGYADSLAALYVTGYDPNLFYVTALGPYRTVEEPRRCFKDFILEEGGSYEGYVMCAAGDDAYVGGGLGGSGSDITQGRLDVYNVNVGRFLDDAVSWIRGEKTETFSELGLFEDLDMNCDWDEDGSRNDVDRRGSFSFGGGDTACRLSWGIPNMFFQRGSRGSLLIAMHGGEVRRCKNGCTLVPPQSLPGNRYLDGDDAEFPGGEGMYVDYGVFMDKSRWPANLNDHEQLFQVTACYLYTTYATPLVCIDPNPATSQGEACRPGVIDMRDPQPAPLRISKIEQHSQGSQVVFTFHVENTLSGTPFSPGAIDFCSPASPEAYARQYRNKAEVVDARVLGSLEALDCRDGVIHLRNGRGKISCTYQVPPGSFGRGAFETTLNVEIGYLYRDIQSFRTSVHRI